MELRKSQKTKIEQQQHTAYRNRKETNRKKHCCEKMNFQEIYITCGSESFLNRFFFYVPTHIFLFLCWLKDPIYCELLLYNDYVCINRFLCVTHIQTYYFLFFVHFILENISKEDFVLH